MKTTPENKLKPWQQKLHEVIYEADTLPGKVFDIVLLVLIVLSMIVVMVDSLQHIPEILRDVLFVAEWVITVLFTLEYILRLISIAQPRKYVFSAFGIIDLLSLLPTYLSVFFVQSHYLIIIRSLRLLRIFRVFKLVHFTSESRILLVALMKGSRKITVFLFFVLLITIILGSAMYVIEGEANSGFSDIPTSVYWAIVTLTTVGYGDISPITPLGKFIASVIMITGYSIIAFPTGIMGVEYTKALKQQKSNTQSCPHCLFDQHDDDAVFCKKCGTKIKEKNE